MANMIEAMKDHTLYKDAHEKFVKCHVVYVGITDNIYAYLDPECTKKISCQDLMNATLDGIVINYEGLCLVFPDYAFISHNNDGVNYFVVSGLEAGGGRVEVYSEEYNPDDAGAE